ncbi:MAG: hypothetical protein NVV68_08575 [Dokdonella sp.]|nr:hypothetical protein [Dokdonella sp.]
MNIIAEEVYVGRFDPDVGTDKIESRLQKGDVFKHDHLRAFRMSKEELVYNWLRYIQHVAKNYFINTGKPIQEDKLFHYLFPEQLWINIRNFVRNLSALPLWVNKDLSETVFGGKQNNSFWQTVFETGRSPHGVQVLAKPLNLVEMIK